MHYTQINLQVFHIRTCFGNLGSTYIEVESRRKPEKQRGNSHRHMQDIFTQDTEHRCSTGTVTQISSSHYTLHCTFFRRYKSQFLLIGVKEHYEMWSQNEFWRVLIGNNPQQFSSFYQSMFGCRICKRIQSTMPILIVHIWVYF